jgi:predicted Zn-dependent peptidase
MAKDFDAAILHNTVSEDLGADDHLAQLLDATAHTRLAQEVREDDLGSDGDRVNDVGEAAGTLSHVARTRAREVVAEACATIIDEADEWAADGHIGEQSARDAQHEAREWLQLNTNVSGRLGLLEEVSA